MQNVFRSKALRTGCTFAKKALYVFLSDQQRLREANMNVCTGFNQF